MNITAIYATARKARSTTYQLSRKVIEALQEEDEVCEFFLPRDMNHFCTGCFSCFEGHPERCPAYEQLQPIRAAMEKSELIIFTTPVYVYHVPGQVKTFLDHFGYNWVVHQLNESMLHKQVLIISTAAGAGLKSTIKDIKDSMDFWCVGRVYTYKKSLFKAHWTELKKEEQLKLEADILKIADKIKRREGNVKPRLKVKALFYGVRLMQKHVGLNPVDVSYWKEKGWLNHKRPW